MIIDQTYFRRKLSLPQTGNTDGLADVLDFIDTYEPEYLQAVLGYDLWKAFNAGTEGSGLPDQRWQDLLTGAEFTRNGCTYKWPGFQNQVSKISPIANYVFYQFIDNKITDVVLVGTVASKTDNNREKSPLDRLVDTWNRMVDMNNTLYHFLKVKKSVYPEWKICGCGCYTVDLCGCGCGDDPAGERNLFKKINSLGL